jgi:hypothetical protein
VRLALDPERRVIGLISASDEDRLDGFQADFSLLLGAGSADPDHTAALGTGRLFIEENFDHLAALKFETSAQPETFYGRIEDKTGGSLFGLRSRLTTRLARLFDTTRFERRALGTGKVGILSLPGLGVVMVRPD